MKAFWIQLPACLTSGSGHKKLLLQSHFPAVILLQSKYGAEGFQESLWKSWQHCCLAQMLMGNISNLKSLEKLEVKPLEVEGKQRLES